MQISISAKGVTIPPKFKEVAEKKLAKLERLVSPITRVDIECSRARPWWRVEVLVNANGLLVRGDARALEMIPALEGLVDKLERQIKRSRSRMITRYREAPSHRESWAEMRDAEVEEREPELGGELVRNKRIAVKPMAPEEAAAQMELLGHDFFVFRNAENEQVNVLYRRKDGNYGLIEPEF